MADSKNYYKILGLTLNATKDEIKKKYKELALRYHPDKNKNSDDMFKKISEAYKVLTDDKERKLYDSNLETHFDNSNIFFSFMDMDDIFSQFDKVFDKHFKNFDKNFDLGDFNEKKTGYVRKSKFVKTKFANGKKEIQVRENNDINGVKTEKITTIDENGKKTTKVLNNNKIGYKKNF